MLIVGTGAIATMLAEGFHAAGLPFQMFGSLSPRVAALNARFGPGVCLSNPSDIGSHNQWIVALKTWQNRSRALLLSTVGRPDSLLVLQNGLCPERPWKMLRGVQVERGLCTYGARSSAPGMVVTGGLGEMIVSTRSALGGALETAGFQVRRSSRLPVEVWHKLSVNASLNVVAALHGVPNGAVLDGGSLEDRVRAAAMEVELVAREAGVAWGKRSAWEITREVARKTSGNICSTLADLLSGRPTEYLDINGGVLRQAARQGTVTPVLRGLERDFERLLRSVSPMTETVAG